jgi:hypothetical protein
LCTDKTLRQFDYDTITDVIMHVSYTAREGGGQLKKKATESLKQTITEGTLKLAEEQGLLRLFSLKHEFSNKWHRFLHPAGATDPHRIELDITAERFPFMFREREIAISKAIFYLKLKTTEGFTTPFTLTLDGNDLTFKLVDGIPTAETATGFSGKLGVWALQAADLNADLVEDLWMVVKYTVAFPSNGD